MYKRFYYFNLWVQLTFSDTEDGSSFPDQQNPKIQMYRTVHAIYLHCCKITVGLPVYLYLGFVLIYLLFLNNGFSGT